MSTLGEEPIIPKNNFNLLHKIMRKYRKNNMGETGVKGYKKLKNMFKRSSSVQRATKIISPEVAKNNFLFTSQSTLKPEGFFTQRESTYYDIK